MILLLGVLSSLTTPAVFAAPIRSALTQSTSSVLPPGVPDGYINISTAMWVGGGITAGVIAALTYIFRLFLNSRDKTDAALNDRISTLERENSLQREAQAKLQADMIDLLKNALLNNQNVMSQHTQSVQANTKTLETLTAKVEQSISNDQEEHTRILGGLGRVLEAYGKVLDNNA